jgi:hypothetical protein
VPIDPKDHHVHVGVTFEYVLWMRIVHEPKRHRCPRYGALLFTILIAACAGSDGGSVCTASFAYLTVHAIDSSGQPVSGLAIRDSVLRTHQAFDVINESFAEYAPGTATVFTDSNIGAVRNPGDSVEVTGAAADSRFTATYVFGSDGCHVRRIAGPDTVVVRGST